MPVGKGAVNSEAMTSYFKEFATFKKAVDQFGLNRPQDSARVWLPSGDQTIGKGLERVTFLSQVVTAVFADMNEALNAEAAPVLKTQAMVEAK